MFHIFKDFFNKERVSALEKDLLVLKKEIEDSNTYSTQLEDRVKELEDYELKYEIAELYIKDDEAIMELLELKKEKDSSVENDLRVYSEAALNQSELNQRRLMAQRMSQGQSMYGMQSGMLGQAFN